MKLRGYRIELPEVEAALLSHPEVREAVAVVREDSPGDKRLVAYVTSDSQHLDISALRSFLKQRLPDFMLPSALVRLEALPLTSSSKVDRKALPRSRRLLHRPHRPLRGAHQPPGAAARLHLVPGAGHRARGRG